MISRADFSSDIYLIAAVCVIFSGLGVRQIRRARRIHFVGRISDAVYRAEIVMGVTSILFLPAVIVVARWLGDLAALALCFVGIAVVVWADETKKNPG